MSEVEKLLADVPAHDPHFVLGVMARIEQRRFRREMFHTLGICAAAMLLLALVMPELEPVLSDSFAPMLNNGVLASLLLILTLAGPRLLAIVREG